MDTRAYLAWKVKAAAVTGLILVVADALGSLSLVRRLGLGSLDVFLLAILLVFLGFVAFYAAREYHAG